LRGGSLASLRHKEVELSLKHKWLALMDGKPIGFLETALYRYSQSM
jgi:hypothetical protein